MNHVVNQISIAKGILSILRYYAPLPVLKKYISASAWGGAAAQYLNKIKVHPNLVVKIMTKVS